MCTFIVPFISHSPLSIEETLSPSLLQRQFRNTASIRRAWYSAINHRTKTDYDLRLTIRLLHTSQWRRITLHSSTASVSAGPCRQRGRCHPTTSQQRRAHTGAHMHSRTQPVRPALGGKRSSHADAPRMPPDLTCRMPECPPQRGHKSLQVRLVARLYQAVLGAWALLVTGVATGRRGQQVPRISG